MEMFERRTEADSVLVNQLPEVARRATHIRTIEQKKKGIAGFFGKKEEIQEKLVQLDMYRLLLSAMEGVPLDAIDACLYYLSEPVEGNRQLNAADKTEEEILAELSYGIPKQSDND